MRYRIPYYYKNFACIGSGCEDTCCGGWRIDIDEKSYSRYQQVPGAFGRRLRQALDPADHSFVQKDRACVLLDEQGLCEIYKHLGRDQMCDTCRNYPRHREDYGDLQEIMLSLSCPEAARVILSDPAQGACLEKKRLGRTLDGVLLRNAGVDEEKRSCLEDIRHVMACILKDRTISFGQRLAMVLAYSHDLQRRWDQAEQLEAAGWPEAAKQSAVRRPEAAGWCAVRRPEAVWRSAVRWMEAAERQMTGMRRAAVKECSRRYLDRKAGSLFLEKLAPFENRAAERMSRMAAWMRCLQELEPVLAHWEKKQGAVCTGLYHRETFASYRKLERQFEKESQGLELCWENLALYFLRTCLLGAVYDDDIYGKGKMIVVSCLLIREWCLFRYRAMGQVTVETLTAAAYRYSREVENSDENLERLERLFAENPLFSLSSILTVLWGGEETHGN